MSCNFDNVVCRHPLPGDVPGFLKQYPAFQTSDLGGGMGDYEITVDGKVKPVWDKELLAYLRSIQVDLEKPREWKRKRIELYGSNIAAGRPTAGGGYEWLTADGSDWCQIRYVVQIRDGVVRSIKETWRISGAAKKYEGQL